MFDWNAICKAQELLKRKLNIKKEIALKNKSITAFQKTF